MSGETRKQDRDCGYGGSRVSCLALLDAWLSWGGANGLYYTDGGWFDELVDENHVYICTNIVNLYSGAANDQGHIEGYGRR